MPTYSRLTLQNRNTFKAMNRNCYPQKEIAKTIGVSTSTISRKLRRNGINRENYCVVAAQRHAESREWMSLQIVPKFL
jgi:IS30 family transposase